MKEDRYINKSNRKKNHYLRMAWDMLGNPSSRYLVGGCLITGSMLGAIALGALSRGVEATNTMDFCISCHELRQTVYEEYIKTAHYANRTGVRATCADCHVPQKGMPMLVRKIKASRDLFHHFARTIDTPAKFEAKRLELAQRVWTSMKASDSRECRVCHTFTAMVLETQKPRARAQHQDMVDTGETCIDCHKGIAHTMPAHYKEPGTQTDEPSFMLN